MLEIWSIGRKDPNMDDGPRNTAWRSRIPRRRGIGGVRQGVRIVGKDLRSLGRHAFALEELSEEAIEKEFELVGNACVGGCSESLRECGNT
jgi:hypothetical protein